MEKIHVADRAFYRHALTIAIPIIIQNGITNFVSLLDNVMVGQIGTTQMSGVAIVNQLIFVFNLCIFGAVSGAGIFTAQFYGKQDYVGVGRTFRFKILIGLLVGVGSIVLFSLAADPLIMLYMQGDDDPGLTGQTLEYARQYLSMMLWGLIPFALNSAYSSTLRETGQAVVPMVAGIVAVFLNLILNWVLIFGALGMPAMGVRGAALATVISRYVELGIVAVWTHRNPGKNPFIKGIYRSFYIPGRLLLDITVKGMPLLVNEFLWSSGMTFLNQSYSTRGLNVVAAVNISATLSDLSNVVFLAIANVVGILTGQMLGAGTEEKELREKNRKLIMLALFSCVLFSSVSLCVSGLFPKLYNTTDEIRSLATVLICVNALYMPVSAYNNSCYFTLRSGGKTGVTFLFDSGFTWCINVPLAFCLSRFTQIPVVPMYILCLGSNLLKCALGTWMLKKGDWIQNLADQ